jgi:hypothetical protein
LAGEWSDLLSLTSQGLADEGASRLNEGDQIPHRLSRFVMTRKKGLEPSLECDRERVEQAFRPALQAGVSGLRFVA